MLGAVLEKPFAIRVTSKLAMLSAILSPLINALPLNQTNAIAFLFVNSFGMTYLLWQRLFGVSISCLALGAGTTLFCIQTLAQVILAEKLPAFPVFLIIENQNG